jgi:hypothetical protein
MIPALRPKSQKNSQHRMSRLNEALAWVGIVARGLLIVAAIFLSGRFVMPSTSRNCAARGRTFLAGQCAPRASTAGPLTKPGPVETRTRPIGSTPTSPVTRHSPEAVYDEIENR